MADPHSQALDRAIHIFVGLAGMITDETERQALFEELSKIVPNMHDGWFPEHSYWANRLEARGHPLPVGASAANIHEAVLSLADLEEADHLAQMIKGPTFGLGVTVEENQDQGEEGTRISTLTDSTGGNQQNVNSVGDQGVTQHSQQTLGDVDEEAANQDEEETRISALTNSTVGRQENVHLFGDENMTLPSQQTLNNAAQEAEAMAAGGVGFGDGATQCTDASSNH